MLYCQSAISRDSTCINRPACALRCPSKVDRPMACLPYVIRMGVMLNKWTLQDHVVFLKEWLKELPNHPPSIYTVYQLIAFGVSTCSLIMLNHKYFQVFGQQTQSRIHNVNSSLPFFEELIHVLANYHSQ